MGELTKGQNGQLPAVHVYSQCGTRGVHGARGAVFRDIGARMCTSSWFQAFGPATANAPVPKCVTEKETTRSLRAARNN